MYKTAIISIVFLLSLGCKNNTEIDLMRNKIESLSIENDSLKRIVEEINGKYVFDSISFRDIYSPKNTRKLNSEFEVELLVVGYNPDKSFFVKFDSIADGQKVNPDTLKQSNGGFKYITILKDKENEIRIDMNVENDYGKNKRGVLYENVRIKN